MVMEAAAVDTIYSYYNGWCGHLGCSYKYIIILSRLIHNDTVFGINNDFYDHACLYHF